MKYIPLANLKNTTGIVAFCKEANEIVVANRNGLPKLVLMSREVYENGLGKVMDNPLINVRRDIEFVAEPVLIRTFNNPAEIVRICESEVGKVVPVLRNGVDEIYVEDVVSTQQYAILNRKNNLITQSITVDEEFSNLLNKDNILEDFFYLDKSKRAEDLLQAIVWLNTSLKTENYKEKIISLYNCLEFLVTGEKGNLLSQELHLAYGSEYDTSIEEIRRVVSEIQNEELRERISGVIKSSFEGNSSLQSKLEALINRLPIMFESRDWELFNKLKQNRQKLIHNKKISAPITKQELHELFHLFSKVIIYRIIDVSNGGKND